MRKSRNPISLARCFVELCARSNFSFLQGASHPEELVEESIRLNYDGISITDLNGLYGVVRAYQTATAPSLFSASPNPKKHFISIFGTEVTLADTSETVILTPLTHKGYIQLCQLLTLGKRNAQKGFSKINSDEVLKHNEDLMIFTPASCFLRFQESFPERIYIPVYRDYTWESLSHCEEAFRLEKEYGAKLFVTQKPVMHCVERKMVFDALTCILHHTTLVEAKNILTQNAERYLHSLENLSDIWQDRLDLIETTLGIAQKVTFSLSEIRYRYPQAQLLPGQSTADRLRELAEKGFAWRFPDASPLAARTTLNDELKLIRKLQYEDYFLTLWEICQFADARGILYQGRGSAANSVVCFCLGLTSVSPTKVDIVFERFISETRSDPPDIDIDFEHERREEVIQHIYEKYDAEHAAMVCTVIRYKSKMAIRESAKVFGMPLKTINAMIKFIGRDGLKRLVEPGVHARFGIKPHPWSLFLVVAKELYGFPRHLGIHTGGFLISQNRITEIVPVEKATMNGRYVIQWNKDDVNFLKLMKIDILSLGMLTALRKALVLLKKHKQLDWNLAQIPPEDAATYEDICKADTVGVFQIESRAQMQMLPRLKPICFYDLVIEVALVRPGPIQGGMVHPFLKRRLGVEKVRYPHPKLEKILKKTMGIPIFQEQVMKIVSEVAGFSRKDTDEFRRIMALAWRKNGTMEGMRARIFNGFKENGISQQDSEQIYKTIEGFANYGFPESHAASFALLTYASAYLHTQHPDIFVCALLNSQPMGFYSPRSLIADAQKHGVKVLPLDIQRSSYDYTLEPASRDQQDEAKRVGRLPPLALRVGFCSIQGVTKSQMQQIEILRNEGGLFLDLSDFVKRTNLPRSTLMTLAAAGALQDFNTTAREMIWAIEALSLDQESFLWGVPKENFQSSKWTVNSPYSEELQLPTESPWEEMKREYAYKGFSIHLHPLSILRAEINEKNELLKKQNQVPFFHGEDLKSLSHGSSIRVAGFVGIVQRPPTAKGMCFITIEDEFNFINIVIPPDVYQKDRLTIYSANLLEIWGKVEKVNSVTNVKANRVFPLTRLTSSY